MRYNQPYSGMDGMMYAADRHGAHHRLPCLELELNHTLIGTPRSQRRLGAIAARALGELISHR